MENKSRNTFTGSLGFVLAAAGSAVGLGNIWRFPYLTARDGGGLFLIVYLVLALTFGFSLLITEIAIGRKTKQGALTAFKTLRKKWKFLGVISCAVSLIVMPYYCVIGGWVLKYLVVFACNNGDEAAADGYFNSYISNPYLPVIFMALFLLVTGAIVLGGVDKGIEKFSKIVMPVLFVLIVFIAVYSIFLSGTDDAGVKRTGFEGLKILFIPDLEDLTFQGLADTVMDAMGQLFYSLSLGMGILIAYGSYMKDDVNINKAVSQIEIFDTAVAILAAIMIIPAVYVFQGREGLESSGPGLMFISLPKVFMKMGLFGQILGIMFFALVLFAAITSAVSMMESVVSSFMDAFGWSRRKATLMEMLLNFLLGIVVCLGYSFLYFKVKLPNGATGQILDIFDYVSNNILMPINSIGCCILVGWILKPQIVINEVTKNGEKFARRGMYSLVIKFVAPLILTIILLAAFGVF